ncbi:MAG: hypothetical protein R3D57_00280 [Hyphomicrobiaceae bacterium]
MNFLVDPGAHSIGTRIPRKLSRKQRASSPMIANSTIVGGILAKINKKSPSHHIEHCHTLESSRRPLLLKRLGTDTTLKQQKQFADAASILEVH